MSTEVHVYVSKQAQINYSTGGKSDVRLATLSIPRLMISIDLAYSSYIVDNYVIRRRNERKYTILSFYYSYHDIWVTQVLSVQASLYTLAIH